MLKKLFKSKAKSFDSVKKMVTRNLPIPGLEGTKYHVVFTAKKSKDGYWTMQGVVNMNTVTEGREMVNEAFRNALVKHSSRPLSEMHAIPSLTFDTVFQVLRDLEDSLLKYNGTPAGAEPKDHFLSVYRMMEDSVKARYDEVYFRKNREKGPILPPKSPDADADAEKAPKGPAFN